MALPKPNYTRPMRRERQPLPLTLPIVSEQHEFKTLHMYLKLRNALLIDLWQTYTRPDHMSILELPYHKHIYFRAKIEMPDGQIRKIYFSDKHGYWVQS